MVSFTLDSPGVWKFRVQATDSDNRESAVSLQNSVNLRVRNPALSNSESVTPKPTRLVGAYFNAGQRHQGFEEMWHPASGRWDYKWGPNPVAPFTVNWLNPTEPGLNILYGPSSARALLSHYLGWADIYGFPLSDETNRVRDIAGELAYSGIDFVIIDHTNLVFSYTFANEFGFTNNDNSVTRAATSLKNGFAAFASPPNSPRIKMTFMLGLTTAWFPPAWDSGNNALTLRSL